MKPPLHMCALFLILLICPGFLLRGQDVVPVPTSPLPSDIEADQSENRCLNGYNIVTCSGENAKFAQAFDITILLAIPVLGAMLFLFGPLLGGHRHWWLAQPWKRLWICLGGVFAAVFAALLLAPFIPQASPIRFEVGPLSWLLVDAKFIESCLPCRDGVTNPGFLFGRIRWVMPPHGLVPEHPMPMAFVAIVTLVVWFLLATIAFLGLRLKTGIGAGSGR